MNQDESRIYGKKIQINEAAAKKFYESRAKKMDPNFPENSMHLQDKNQQLAKARDATEKMRLLKIMQPQPSDAVLDVGAGIGRWAGVLTSKVKLYHGIEPVPELVDTACERNKNFSNVSFQRISAEDMNNDTLKENTFSLIIIAGVLHYVNDDSLEKILKNVRSHADERSRILIRGPFAIEERLSLDGFWAQELEAEYSAIYRTMEEFLSITSRIFHDFSLEINEPLYPDELESRKETRQYVMLFNR